MSKDPAFLFYPSDFLIGTTFFSDEEVGQYIRLLCYQHQLGHIHENHMKIISKSYDFSTSQVWRKFVKDKDGLWYNERLDIEKTKRANYAVSRGNNKKGHFKEKIISKSYENHMVNENISENEDVVLVETTVKSSEQSVFMSKFMGIYLKNTGLTYNDKKTDYILIAGLIKKHSFPVVQLKAEILQDLCKGRKAWFTKDGFSSFTISTLSKHFNSIINEEKTGNLERIYGKPVA